MSRPRPTQLVVVDQGCRCGSDDALLLEDPLEVPDLCWPCPEVELASAG
jgi:hypothetical protein